MPRKKKVEHPGWGGPRQASQGKRIGRPLKLGENLERLDVRIPPTWRAAIESYGGGSFVDGLRKIIQESGIVPPPS